MRNRPSAQRLRTLRAVAVALAMLAGGAASGHGAQGRSSEATPGVRSHVTIPYLANASKPTDLDFAAAECELTADALTMTCRFRQVFVTPVSFDRTTCAITSNGYERTFTRSDARATRWISADPPQGTCGLVETHTLDDGGGTRWTLTVATTAKTATAGACAASADETTIYDWRVMKRALPCAHIQPGAIER